MEKFVPYEKLSKRKQRELDQKSRSDWGALNPVTKKPQNPKAYNRKKARKWSEDSSFPAFLFSQSFFKKPLTFTLHESVY